LEIMLIIAAEGWVLLSIEYTNITVRYFMMYLQYDQGVCCIIMQAFVCPYTCRYTHPLHTVCTHVYTVYTHCMHTRIHTVYTHVYILYTLTM